MIILSELLDNYRAYAQKWKFFCLLTYSFVKIRKFFTTNRQRVRNRHGVVDLFLYFKNRSSRIYDYLNYTLINFFFKL